MFAFDFLANCTSVGAGPQGKARIIVDRRGTMFGDFNVPHGGNLSIDVGPTGITMWQVFRDTRTPDQGGTATNVEVSAADGRVTGIRFEDLESTMEIRCVPLGDVSVAGKHPSAMALIRLLAQSIRDPVFQCLPPVTFPGFVEGANTLAIEQNGALRINGPGGPSFHLPSTVFIFQVGLSMAADGIAPTGARGSDFSQLQQAPDGSQFASRSARLSLSVDGRIDGVEFAGPSGGRVACGVFVASPHH
jgi:hypothetical protein